MSHRIELITGSSPIKKLPRCSSRVQDFSQRNCKIRVLSRNLLSLNQKGNGTTEVFAQNDVPVERNISVPKHAKEPESQAQLSQIDGEPKSNKSEPTCGTIIYQPSCGQRGLPKLKLTEFSGGHSEWADWADFSISLCIKSG